MSVADSDHPGSALSLLAISNDWKLPSHLLGRIYLFAAVLLVEYTAIVSVPHPWCTLHRFVAGAIVFLAVFLFVGKPLLKSDHSVLGLNRPLLVAYGISLVAIAVAHGTLLRTVWARDVMVVVWFAAIPISAALLLCALIPVRILPSLLHRTRLAWLYATIALLLILSLSGRVQAIWDSPQSWGSFLLQRTTFQTVGRVLNLFYPQVQTDPATYTILLPKFDVTIAGSCSGIEGLCLTLMFTAGWLWYARRELRFPRALLLVPCAMAVIWLLNILRIVALLAIGNAGHPSVAEHGFHSEAGWIAFNIVALGFLAIANRSPWLARDSCRQSPVNTVAERNAATIYLLPFLAILAAGLLSKAAAGGFEWAYPLRFLAAATVLWHYRGEYRRIDWRFDWTGPAVGVAVFVMWIALSRSTGGSSANETGSALSAMPAAERIGWLIIRVAAAVITVPVAEELAFRGFLLRRLRPGDLEAVPYRSVTILAILLSSAAFGAMHGKQWLAGIVAGIAYALLVKRSGRLGEAVAAHSTTNLLLAVWVLARGDWGLW